MEFGCKSTIKLELETKLYNISKVDLAIIERQLIGNSLLLYKVLVEP